MLDHGNCWETVKFQLSVYPMSLSLPSTAEGPDGVALKFTVSSPAFPEDWQPVPGVGHHGAAEKGNGLTRMGWLAVPLKETFPPPKLVDLTPADASRPLVN